MSEYKETITTIAGMDASQFFQQLNKMDSQTKAFVTNYVKNIKTAKAETEGSGAIDLEKVFGKPSEAVGNIWSSASSKALEEGASKLGVFGGALEALGPAGLGAAAAVAAFGLSLEQAKQAMEYAETVQHLAEVLGTTTDKVQELNAAAAVSGVSADTAKQGIEALTVAIGAYQSNVKDKRVATVFQALGISKDEARQWQDPIDGLQAIAEGLDKVGSQAEKVALAKALRIPPDMLPMLDQLVEKMAAAKANGSVIDAKSVSDAAELNKQLAGVNNIVSVQLKEAFISLAPAVVTIATWMANIAKSSNEWLQNMMHGSGGIGGFDPSKMTEDVIQKNATGLHASMGKTRADLESQGVKFDGAGNIVDSSVRKDSLMDTLAAGSSEGSYESTATMAQDYKNQQSQYKAYIAEWGKRINADRTPPPGTGGIAKPLVPEVVKALPKDNSNTQLETAQGALAGAQQKLAESEAKLAGSYDEATADQIASIQAGYTKSIDALEKERSSVIADDTNTLQKLSQTNTAAAQAEAAHIKSKEKDTLSTISAAEMTDQQTMVNEVLLAQRQNELKHMQDAEALRQDQYSLAQLQYKQSGDIYSLNAQLATNTKDRNAFEVQALAEQQAAERTAMQARADAAQAALDNVKKTSPNNADEIAHAQNNLNLVQSQQAALPQTQQLQRQAQAKSQENPGQQYLDQLNNSTDQFTNLQVDALKSFNSGLTDAIMNSKNLGDVFHNVAKQILTDLLQIAVQKTITQPLANMLFGGGQSPTGGAVGSGLGVIGSIGHLFGFASGTDSAPGGLAMVGENGPELMNVPRGSQVIPHNNMGLPSSMSGAGGSVDNSTNITVHADNAQTVNDIKTWTAQVVMTASQGARRAAVQDVAGAQRRTF